MASEAERNASDRPASPGAGAPTTARGRMLRGRLLKASELVAQEILLDIVERGLTAGERLPNEVQMTEQYGVARSTIREALRILEVNGLVQMRTGPKGGPSVRQAGPADLARTLSLFLQAERVTVGEVLAARRVLEVLFLREAMLEGSDDFRERAAELRDRTRRTDPDDDQAYLAVTSDFHELVSRGSSNRVLTAFATALMAMFQGEVDREAFPAADRARLLEDHVDILDKALSGDIDGAAAALSDHGTRMHAGISERQPRAFASVIRWR